MQWSVLLQCNGLSCCSAINLACLAAAQSIWSVLLQRNQCGLSCCSAINVVCLAAAPDFSRVGNVCDPALGSRRLGQTDVSFKEARKAMLWREELGGIVCLLVGCFTSQRQASVSQGRICSDNFTCCHTEVDVADLTFYLTQSQYTDTGPTSPSADPITPGDWQGSHWSANF